MSLAISNAKNVVIKNFSIIQPQFWASIIIDSEDVWIQDFYVNATSYNPSVRSVSHRRDSGELIKRPHMTERAGWRTPMVSTHGGPRMSLSVSAEYSHQ
jgi:hypothetical protein